MNREIKFRAWDKDRKEMITYISSISPIVHNILHINLPYIIMQYTWLKDKNWVEIYEGDIVYDKMNNKFAEVKMNSFWRWSLYWINWERMNEYQGEYFFSWIYPDNHNLEIKWNIYENPNLLDNK